MSDHLQCFSYRRFRNVACRIALAVLVQSCSTSTSVDHMMTDVKEIPLSAVPGGEYLRVDRLVVNSRREIVFSDRRNSRLICLASDGTYLKEIGRRDKRTGEISYPTAMVFDARDNLYVVGARNVVVFDSDYEPKFRFQIEFFNSPVTSIGVDAFGNIYLVGYRVKESESKHVVHKFTSKGNWIASFGESFVHSDSGISEYYSGGKILIDGSRIVLSYTAFYDVSTFDLDGNIIDRFQRPDLGISPKFEITVPGRGYRFLRSSRSLSICSLGRFLVVQYYLLDKGKFLDICDIPSGSVKNDIRFNVYLLNTDKDGNMYYRLGTSNSIFRGRPNWVSKESSHSSNLLISCLREVKQCVSIGSV